jgi:hypothetical protein
MPRETHRSSRPEKTASRPVKRKRVVAARDPARSTPAGSVDPKSRSFALQTPELTYGVRARNVLAYADYVRGVPFVPRILKAGFCKKAKSEPAPSPVPAPPELRKVFVVFHPATAQKVLMH